MYYDENQVCVLLLEFRQLLAYFTRGYVKLNDMGFKGICVFEPIETCSLVEVRLREILG